MTDPRGPWSDCVEQDGRLSGRSSRVGGSGGGLRMLMDLCVLSS